MMHYEQQRGSIIVYSLLTMSVMLAIGIALTALFIGKLKIASSARNSTIAIYAADSAVEKCLYEARHGPNGSNQPPLVFTDPAISYIVTKNPSGADVKDNCETIGSVSFQFRATGIFHGVQRTLEINE